MKSIRNKLVRLAFLFVPLLFYFVAAADGASVDVFLKIDGIQGGSNDSHHANEIVALSFKIGVLRKGATRPQFTPLTVFKFIDKASPRLFLASATGEHRADATLVVRRGSAPNSFEFFKIVLTDVVISSVDDDASSTDENGNLVESITLSYSKIIWTFIPQEIDGSPGPPVTFGWDVLHNRPL